jgi:putative ABC transport system ATP-binding protein
MQILQEVNRQGITMIIVTHESGVARYTNQIIRLKDGIIEDIHQNQPGVITEIK